MTCGPVPKSHSECIYPTLLGSRAPRPPVHSGPSPALLFPPHGFGTLAAHQAFMPPALPAPGSLQASQTFLGLSWSLQPFPYVSPILGRQQVANHQSDRQWVPTLCPVGAPGVRAVGSG